MTTTTASDVLLVGSLPFDDAESAFRAAASTLAGHIGWVPDGEFGQRKLWTAMLPEFVYSKEPDLDETTAPSSRTVEPPPLNDGPPPTDMPGFWTFRIKPGRALHFCDLAYGRIAAASYRVFERLRDEGVIPGGLRFQVSLPTPHSALDPYFDDTEQWPEAEAAYVEGIKREIDKVFAVAPADDLAFQWDCANEIVDLGMGANNAIVFAPKLSVEEKFERHASQLGTLGDMIPEGAMLGFHWCYGTWGGWPSIAMPDLEVCVRFSNEAVKRVRRHVDYVHMPALQNPEASFFAPLQHLDLGETKVFLGIVHHTDSIDDFRRRRDLARAYLSNFGIGSVWGYGRLKPEDVHGIMELHAAQASEL